MIRVLLNASAIVADTSDRTLYAQWRSVWGDIDEGDRVRFSSVDEVPSAGWTSLPERLSRTYTGKPVTLDDEGEIRVYYHDRRLVEGRDYTVRFSNNVNATDNRQTNKNGEKAMITFEGKGNYSGTIAAKTFEIAPLHIGDSSITLPSATIQTGTKKLSLTVTGGSGNTLKSGTDYEIAVYSLADTERNNPLNITTLTPGDYQLVYKGKGNYFGSSYELSRTPGLKVVETILPADRLTVEGITAKDYDKDKNAEGLVEQSSINVLYDKIPVPATGYSLHYENNDRAGSAFLIVTGSGESVTVGDKKITVTGEKKLKFKIAGKSAISKAVISGISNTGYAYSGEEFTYDELNRNGKIMLKIGEDELVKERDYRVELTKNKDAGTAKITFEGIGSYTGKITKNFKITKVDVDKGEIEVDVSDVAYRKSGARPEPDVYFHPKENSADEDEMQPLVLGKDYKLSYKENKGIGNATVTVIGKGNFTGRTSERFKIEQQSISVLDASAPDKTFKRGKKMSTYLSIPTITDQDGKKLTKGKDFESTVLYTYADSVFLSDGTVRVKGDEVKTNDVPADPVKVLVSVTGKGNYKGTITTTYQVAEKNLNSVSFEKIDSFEFTGEAIEPGSEFIKPKNVTLVYGKDYEITGYTSNITPGMGKVTIHGLGAYGGYKTLSFKIMKRSA